MKHLLNEFTDFFLKSEEFQREVTNLQRAIQSEQWGFYRKLLVTIRGMMATDMFSKRYTGLTPEEKDVMQRTYYNIDQMLNFLTNPIGWMKKTGKWQMFQTNLKRKEKVDGRRKKD